MDILVSGLAVGCIYSLIAMAYSLIFRSSGILNIAQGQIVMLGAMVAYTLLTSVTHNFYLSIFATMVATGIAGYVVQKLVFRPVHQRGGDDLHMMIASIGLLVILPQVGALVWGANPLSYPLTVVGQVHLGGISLSAMNALIICVSVAIMLLFHLFFRFSRYGQAMRAIAEDRVMAQLMGIHTDKYIGIIFIIAFALTGAAGVLLGSAYYISYDIGSVGVKAFAAAVLGGFGDVTGAMIGGILLGLVEAFGGTMISSSYRDVLVYGILILILIVRPSGILGVAQRRDAA